MLKKENRLKKESNFQWVFRRGKPVFFNNLIFRVVPSKRPAITGVESNSSRFGLVISAKVEKSAVRRNAMRRHLYDLIKESLPRIRDSIDVVIVLKKSFSFPLDLTEIKKSFEEGGRRAGIFK